MRTHLGSGGWIAAGWRGVAALLIAAALVPAATALAQDDGCGSTYTVEAGDTLYGIAQACGTTVEALLDANPSITDPALIYVGAELTIPTAEPEDGGEEPEDGEPSVSLSPDSGLAGTDVDVAVADFPADTEVVVEVGAEDAEPTTSVSEMTDEDGALETTITIPEDEAEAGETWVVVVSTGGTDAVKASADFVVVEEETGDDGADEGDGEDEGGTYTVQPGDTLYRIAQQYETTVEALVEANPAITDPAVIRAGQVLTIPTLDQGDSEDADEDEDEAEAGGSYTVIGGDTLYSIARRHGTTVEEMLDLNPAITNPAVIYVGQVLNVP